MKLAFVGHPEQLIHADNHLRRNEVNWPDGVPVPSIGDRLFIYGTEVEIVGRVFTQDPLSRGGEAAPIELTWVDARYGMDGTGRYPERARRGATD
jgi:hypothetical protein